MRLIDADEIKWRPTVHTIGLFVPKGEEYFVRKEDIDDMPTVEVEVVPKWIPVEVKLPEEWEPVLAMIYIDKLPNKPIIDTMWFIGNINGRNRWRVCWNSDMVESDVTHWMPLPDYHPDYSTKKMKRREKDELRIYKQI